MSLPTFFLDSLRQHDQLVELDANESHHAITVRRLKQGDVVALLNGRGLLAEGSITKANKKCVEIQVNGAQQQDHRSVELSIACALPKGDRQQTLVEALTQLSVARIIPLSCDFSASKYSEKQALKWKRYALEACKQSQNVWLPEIVGLSAFSQLVSEDGLNLFFADAAGMSMTSLALPSRLTMLIGPEGGFSENELTLLKQHKVQGVRLSDSILRTEIAAITTAAQIQAISLF